MTMDWANIVGLLGSGLMVVAFGLAVAAGAYLVAVGGPVIVAIGLASIASGVAYTGGPYPLGYHGPGDLFVMIFFGFVAVKSFRPCDIFLQRNIVGGNRIVKQSSFRVRIRACAGS